MKSKRRSLFTALSFLLMLALVACSGRLFTYQGVTAKPENRIALRENGPHEGVWKTRDLSISYEHSMVGSELEIAGVVEFAQYLRTGYNTLRKFSLAVNYLDPDGIVLDTRPILTQAQRPWILLKAVSFKTRFDLPAETAAIAFSYRGQAGDEGGGGGPMDRHGEGVSWDFWQGP
ncbi:hypothetical protein ACFL9U_13980 [Thermodesulfobacteriota bacterium]